MVLEEYEGSISCIDCIFLLRNREPNSDEESLFNYCPITTAYMSDSCIKQQFDCDDFKPKYKKRKKKNKT